MQFKIKVITDELIKSSNLTVKENFTTTTNIRIIVLEKIKICAANNIIRFIYYFEI